MKKLLITGLNGYIGNQLEEWVSKTRSAMLIDRISMKDNVWETIDFGQYDVIIHLVGIAHRKETSKNRQLYYNINRDLTIKLALKAKEDGVKHFVFISTMSVFGQDEGVIDCNTLFNPNTHYGKSKYQAELELKKIENQNFIVSIIRPPMVYGFNSVGNYTKLASLIKKVSFFPNVENKRSMISIQNLNEFICLLVDNPQSGNFHPQNKKFVSTKELALEIARNHNKKLYLIPDVFCLFTKLSRQVKIVRKVLGDLVYSPEMSCLLDNNGDVLEYNVVGFRESIEEAERS